MYASPDKSCKGFGIEVYDRVANSIAMYVKGKCMVFGDMNAHTEQEPDYVLNDGDDGMNTLLGGYHADIPMRRRNSDESKSNENGQTLLDLCMSSGLRILNGRKIGDMFGSCTYFGPMCKKPTLLDYGLAYRENFHDITLFRVQDLFHLSDHSFHWHCLIYGNYTRINSI